MLLPEAFRSLSRLSSALSAKASTLRSCSLDLFVLLSGAASLACEAALHLQSHGSIEEINSSALVLRHISFEMCSEFLVCNFRYSLGCLKYFTRKIFQFLYAVFKVQEGIASPAVYQPPEYK